MLETTGLAAVKDAEMTARILSFTCKRVFGGQRLVHIYIKYCVLERVTKPAGVKFRRRHIQRIHRSK